VEQDESSAVEHGHTYINTLYALATNAPAAKPGYDVKLHPVPKAQFSTFEVLVAMPMTRWELRIVPCLAGGNASATCLKMLVMRFADVQ